jgi:hypothetical protein
VTGQWFSPGTPVSSTNKTDCHDITEILLKVALNTINQTNQLLCKMFKTFKKKGEQQTFCAIFFLPNYLFIYFPKITR